MVYVIVGFIVIGLIVALLKVVFTFLLDIAGVVTESFSKVFGKAAAIVIAILGVIAFFTYSWVGVFAVVAVGLVLALVVGQITKAGRHITKTVEEHDAQKNERALQNELDRNCRWLGYMNEQMWRKKLPNYAEKKYIRPFGEITQNFAKQMELQNITQNDDWFKPFLEYLVLKKRATVTKMLNEVDCPQFRITHTTPNFQLLQKRLIQGTKEKSVDVGEILRKVETEEEPLFMLTSYGLGLYGADSGMGEDNEANEEFDISELDK